MKRFISILLLCVLVLSLMTGCNQNELGLYQLSNEMSLLSTLKQEGSISFSYNFEDLLDASDEDYDQDKAMMALFNEQVKLLNLDTIYYTSSMNQSKNMLEMNYYLLTDDNKKQELFDVRLIDSIFYVNYDGISGLILPYLQAASDADPELLAFFENSTGYIQFDLNELLGAGSDYTTTQASMQLKGNLDLSKRRAFLVELQKDFTVLMEETMKDFTTDLVEKTYSKTNKADMYTYTVKSDDLVDVGLSFVQYFLNNFTQFRTFYVSILENDNFLSYLGLTTEEDKEMYVQTVTDGLDMIEANLEEAKTEIDTMVENENETGQYKAMLGSFLGDSYFTYALGKSSKSYHNDVAFHLSFASPYGTGESFTFDIDANSKSTATSSVTVAVPDEFMTFEEFNNKFPDVVTFDVDYGDYTYKTGLMGSDFGYSNVVIREGRSYVSLDSVPGQLGYAIKWSPADNKPYYLLDDGSGTGFIEDFFVEDGTVYVAFGAYRNLGYSVEWNDVYREIIVTK